MFDKRNQQKEVSGLFDKQESPGQKKTELIRLDEGFDITSSDEEFQQIIRGQLEHDMEGVKARLPKIKILKEVAKFEFPDGRLRDSFECLVIDTHLTYAFWYGKYETTNIKPPDCSSNDGKKPSQWTGDKPISEYCANCPKNQYGTAVNDDGTKSGGKACKDLRPIYLFLLSDKDEPSSLLPYRIILPPSNLKYFDSIVSDNISEKFPFLGLIMEFSLEKQISGKHEVSVIKGRRKRLVAKTLPEYVKKIKEYEKLQISLIPQTRGQQIMSDDYEADDTIVQPDSNENMGAEPPLETEPPF